MEVIMSVLNKLVIAVVMVASFLSGSVKELLSVSTISNPAPTEESKGGGGATAL